MSNDELTMCTAYDVTDEFDEFGMAPLKRNFWDHFLNFWLQHTIDSSPHYHFIEIFGWNTET